MRSLNAEGKAPHHTADDLDVWAEQMIAGGAAQHLARSWQVMHRPLRVEERLLRWA